MLRDIETCIKNPELAEILIRALNSIADPVVITNADLSKDGPIILFVNEAFCKKTGYSKDEAVGQTPRILQTKNTNENFKHALKTALSAGETFFGITTNRGKDGREYMLQLNIAPVFKDGKIINYVAVQEHYAID